MIATLLAGWILAQSASSPGEAEALFKQGAVSYAQGDSKAARKAFESLLESGRGSADVLYNAGTAALASGDLGHAVLYLERALLAGGSADDVEANLAAARARQLDQVVGEGTERSLIERLADATREPMAAYVLLGAVWLAAGLLVFWRRLPAALRPSLAAVLGLLAIAGVASAGVVVVHQLVLRELQSGVVVASTLPCRDAPSAEGQVAFEMHAGLKVRVVQRLGSFVRVRLPNGREGWADGAGVADL